MKILVRTTRRRYSPIPGQRWEYSLGSGNSRSKQHKRHNFDFGCSSRAVWSKGLKSQYLIRTVSLYITNCHWSKTKGIFHSAPLSGANGFYQGAIQPSPWKLISDSECPARGTLRGFSENTEFSTCLSQASLKWAPPSSTLQPVPQSHWSLINPLLCFRAVRAIFWCLQTEM